MKAPAGVRIVECSAIQFDGKDLIYIKKLEDFLWLAKKDQPIFKIGKTAGFSYYIITSEVAYVFSEGGGAQ